MQPIGFVRSLVAGMLVVVVVTLSGCPTPSEDLKLSPPQTSASKQSSEAEPPAPSKLPVAEFQQPAVMPTTQPLPKPTLDPIEPPVVDASVPLQQEKPSEPTNPLRNNDASPWERPAPVVSQEEQQPPPDKTPSSPPAGRPNTGKNSGDAFDPIKVNGPIFVGWPKPKVALIITGMESGYLEPCGCAGLDRMKGGMGRRATLFKELRQKGWPVVGLDVGGLVNEFGQQAILKYRSLVEGKQKMGYDVIAFGADDLRLPAGELLAVAASVDGNPSPFVAANVGLLGRPGEITPQSRILEAAGMKIGVTAILGAEYQRDIHNDEIEMVDPETVLEKIVPELQRQADYLVLLAHATEKESIELGKKFPAFNVVVTSAVPPEEPPRLPETIPGTQTLLIKVGYKGMNAIVLGLFDGDPSCRYQRVPLDSRFATSADMKMLMKAYQEQLKTIGFEGLGLRPVPHPLAETNGRFIGSKKCATCHETSYDIWRKTGHARAYETLEKLDPPRNFDPECISCHVVGWHPTKYFPYAGGYESKEKTPHLIDTGCETCHGPGELHAEAEDGGDTALQEKLRKTVVITKAESKKRQCYSCHDLDNSPDFDFEKYWPFVEHYERE